MLTILRAFLMYRPLLCFTIIGGILFLAGAGIGVRYLVFMFMGEGGGHIQSLILGSTLMLSGVMTVVVGMQADIIAANRKLLEDIQFRVKRLDYALTKPENEELENVKEEDKE